MLIVHQRRRILEPKLPLAVYIDDMLCGFLRDGALQVDAPPATYRLRVQFGGRVPLGRTGRSMDLSLSGSAEVTVRHGGDTTVTIHDRELIWNILFDIDLLLWIASLFFTLPRLYKILSDLFFAVWLVRLVAIRHRYFRIETK